MILGSTGELYPGAVADPLFVDLPNVTLSIVSDRSLYHTQTKEIEGIKRASMSWRSFIFLFLVITATPAPLSSELSTAGSQIRAAGAPPWWTAPLLG